MTLFIRTLRWRQLLLLLFTATTAMTEDLWNAGRLLDESTAREYGVPEDKVDGVVELSKRVQDITADDNGILTDPTTLLRFLIAREGVVEDAEKMLRDSHQWRLDYQMDNLMKEFGVTSEDGVWHLEPQSQRATVGHRHFYGARMEELAKDGSPIILQRLGKFDFEGTAREKMEDLMMNCFVVMLEDCLRMVRRESLKRKRLVRAAFVIDAKGIGSQVLWHKAMIKTFTSVGKTYYAELTRTVTIINAPWVFTGVWKIVSPLLPKASRAKVQISGTSFHSTLEVHAKVDLERLPKYLGGAGAQDICPTETIPMDAGKGINLSRGDIPGECQ